MAVPIRMSVKEILSSHTEEVGGNEVSGIVESLKTLRQREYVDGVVINFTLRDASGTVEVFFNDNWARAISFVCEGDEITVRNFALLPCPEPNRCNVLLLHPTDQSEVRIAQNAEQGDVIEFLVTAKNFDNPIAHVRNWAIGEAPPNGIVLVSDAPGVRVVHE